MFVDGCGIQSLLDNPGPILVTYLMSFVALLWFAFWSFTVSRHTNHPQRLRPLPRSSFALLYWRFIVIHTEG